MSTPSMPTTSKTPGERQESGAKKSWVQVQAGSIDTFISQVSQQTKLSDWPLASSVEQNLLVYAGEHVRQAATDHEQRQALMYEWARALSVGPGIIAITNAMDDMDAIDAANEVFTTIINEQRNSGANTGDHFAKPGANDRVWNALEKHCVANPEGFARYFNNDAIAMISHAWLGRGYQITAQVNRVNPGGGAQTAHRDYHLGFMSPEEILEYPEHVHSFCQMLTLQGAVAHCDMPLESGPTLYMPYSQLHLEGYIAFTRAEYQEYFSEHRRQLALKKGDMVFFNPAVMHAAGDNKSSDIYRMANLLQVGSAFGRSIETIDRVRMLEHLYPTLLQLKNNASVSEHHLHNVICAAAEGYSFPTNLDSDPPVNGMAPRPQSELLQQCLKDNASLETFLAQLHAHAGRRLSVPQ